MATETRYLCVHCDLTFTPEGEGEPRCPRCLRKNLVPREPIKEPVPTLKGRLAIGVAGLVLMLVFGAAYSLWASRIPGAVGDEVPDEALTTRDLRGHLRRLGSDRQELYEAFHGGPKVRRIFGDLPSRSDGAEAIERALRAKVTELVSSGRLRVVPQRGARPTPFHNPRDIAEAVGGGTTVEVSSLEVTLLALTAVRRSGVEARVAEVWAFEGENSPPDPPGRVGYYVLALPEREGTSISSYRLVDLAGASGRRPKAGHARLLDDIETLAAVDVLASAIALERDSDPAAANDRAEEALRLDPRSPHARTMRTLTLAEAGALDEAVAEARAALALRDDPVHRVLLGGMLLPSGDVAEATRLAERAVADAPGYAAAHALLAAISLGQGEVEAARARIATARAADPTLDSLSMLEAAAHALSGETDAAAADLRAYVAARPMDPRAHAEAAGMYARLGMRDQVVVELRAALRLLQGDARVRFTQRIGDAFGAGMLADVVGLPDAGPASEPAPLPEGEGSSAPNPAGSLRLAPPSLGGGAQRRPSLLGPRP